MDVMDAICDALGGAGGAPGLPTGRSRPPSPRHDGARGSRRGSSIGDRERTRRRRVDRHGPAPRRASADGRGRRDPVHAGARRLDGGLRRRWPSRWGRRSRASFRCPSTCTTEPPARRTARRWPRSVAASTRACARPCARGERLPDLGPHAIGKAGADGGGRPEAARRVQRLPRRAEDEPAAKDIARTIRASSGGLPALRAIGFLVPERDCITVSMNLVDFEVTGVRTAYDAVVARRPAPRARGHRLRDRGTRPRGGAARRTMRRTSGCWDSTAPRRYWNG